MADTIEPRPWTITSSIDEMVEAMQESVFVARVTHQRAVDEDRPDAAKEKSMRMWRIRADVLHLLMILREVDPETLPESFTAFANSVAEQMAFLRKTMHEYKALSRAKADLESQYSQLVQQYNDAADNIDAARRAAILVLAGA